ncbi:MAG: L,D-transpeptidase family protein [Pseudomonadota bacterium]
MFACSAFDPIIRPALSAAAIGALAVSTLVASPIAVSPAMAAQADGGVVQDQAVMPVLERLLAGQEDRALAAFYSARSHAPVWASSPGDIAPKAARALRAAVAAAPLHALPEARFRPVELDAALARPWDATSELLFSQVFLDYGRAVSSGLLTPRRLGGYFDVHPIRPEVEALMTGLAASHDADAFLAALAPDDADYVRLMQRHGELLALAATPEPWGPALAKGKSLKEGDRGARVLQLRQRLIAMGDLEESAPETEQTIGPLLAADDDALALIAAAPPDDLFDMALLDAVKRFQTRHGLNTDGVVGPATRAALNISPAKRARQVAVNLERIRWNNGRIGKDRRVVVNMPDFRVDILEGDDIVFTSRAVIGKYKHQTVEFSDAMDHMVINPTWHVPMSIARKEILPKLQEDPNYLEARNMTLVGADAWSIDWPSVTPADFPGRVRQAPGPGNALGRVKFMFPNNHAIYLHDTPQRGLFRRDNRAYSHGCVRVERPLELAYNLLSKQVDQPERSFQRWLATGREIYVNLDVPLPVHLIYRTAFTDVNGEPAFRSDVYRRDALVADALEREGVSLPAL